MFEKIVIEPEKTVDDFKIIQSSCEEDTTFYVVGDRVRKEVKFGNQCGMTTIWFKNGKFGSETPSEKIEEPNYTIKSLEQIEEIIEI